MYLHSMKSQWNMYLPKVLPVVWIRSQSQLRHSTTLCPSWWPSPFLALPHPLYFFSHSIQTFQGERPFPLSRTELPFALAGRPLSTASPSKKDLNETHPWPVEGHETAWKALLCKQSAWNALVHNEYSTIPQPFMIWVLLVLVWKINTQLQHSCSKA